jgi:hypothetical protein
LLPILPRPANAATFTAAGGVPHEQVSHAQAARYREDSRKYGVEVATARLVDRRPDLSLSVAINRLLGEARCPDVSTFDDIPLPNLHGARPVAGPDLSGFARGAQALFQGVSNLGQGIQKGAQDVQEIELYKLDKLRNSKRTSGTRRTMRRHRRDPRRVPDHGPRSDGTAMIAKEESRSLARRVFQFCPLAGKFRYFLL